MGSAKEWSQSEIEYLSDNYGQFSYGTLSKNLNRSVGAIRNKARRLQLGPFLQCGEYVTFHQLLVSIGYANSNTYKMTSWIKNRGFPIHKKKVCNNSFNVVYIKEFWEWAEKNQGLLDFSHFEENILGKEPEWVKKKRKIDYERSRKYRMDPWTKEEDTELKRLVIQQKYTYDQISKMMNRTCGAIQRRLCDLGIKDRPIKADNHIKWTNGELARLKDLIMAGYGYDLISEHINRSSKAIRGLVYRSYGTENLDKVRARIDCRTSAK